MIERLQQSPNDILDRRYELVFLFDVSLGNPNGDPDGDNAPRVDIETGHGLITDVCLKRKVRNFITLTKDNQPPYDIYVKDRGILANEQKKAYLALEETEGSRRPNEQARAWMCKNFYDIRTFGAVMTVGKSALEEGEPGEGKKKKKEERHWNCGQVRGPVQFAFSRSIDPIFSMSHTITRTALTNPGDTGRESAANDDGDEKAATGQMGRKHTVAYGLYRGHIFLSPFLAKDTGFSNADLLLLIDALKNLFEFDRSASRGEMNVCGLYAFEHSSQLGNAPAHKLFEKVQVDEQSSEKPDRVFNPNRVTVPTNGAEVMPGVHLWHLV